MAMSIERVVKLAGVIPIDKVDNAQNILEEFCSHDIVVCITNKTTNICKGTHCHDSYEFVLCNTYIPSTIIDKTICSRNKNSIFAVNPMQEHGIVIDYKGFSLCGIHIDKNLVCQVSQDIYHQSNIMFSNDSFLLDHDLSLLIRMFLEELKYKQSGYDFITENLGMLIIANFMKKIKHNLTSDFHDINKNENNNIKKVIDYMNENYVNGISCTELSKLINTGKFNFIRIFKSKIGKTPHEYLLDLKIEKAKKMMNTNEYTITEISLMCGFSSHSHFTSTFKRKTGISPTAYKMIL